ncbi:uncharacterized protein [Apostichopus japonicus]|uniref:uncharacterized protein n=1 Tax=Stichopus japonicus TaxID=307972 RepID=UPI003AB454E8
MDFENVAGDTYYVTYDEFRISDEWGDYHISSLGTFEISDGIIHEWCPANEIFSNETCERTCDDPDTCISPTSRTETEQCVCAGDYLRHQEQCIPLNQCNCFVADKGGVLRGGESYISSDCSSRITCNRNVLRREGYSCGADATCEARNDIRRCYCNEWFGGDGLTCTRIGPRDCYDLYTAGRRNNGKYTIYPAGSSGFEVYCDMSSGGWTILQRRTSSSVSFNRYWSDYKYGFGIPTGDHWIGNDKIYKLTNQKSYQLRIEKRSRGGSTYYSHYSSFRISSEGDRYRLSLGGHYGNAGYNAMEANSGHRFSTRDQDNDGSSTFDCAEKHRGGWWYPDDSSTGSTSNCYSFSDRVATGDYELSSCFCYYYDCYRDCSFLDFYCSRYCYSCHDDHYKCINCDGCSGSYPCRYCRNRDQVYETHFYSCGYSNLNGDYSSNDYRGIFWKNLHGSECGITTTTMKIQPRQ